MFISNNVGIIADDLTGANDTALQFHSRGCNTQLVLEVCDEIANKDLIQCLAISTESRNIPSLEAYDAVKNATAFMKSELNIEHYYKKIDSTLRGNIARETLAMLEVLEYDAAIIVPAFPNEGRITVGGYQLLKGVPIERTEMARDPYSPIYESHIPTVLERQLTDDERSFVGLIELRTVIKGAGPILMKLNEFIKEGKKLIVIDAVSSVDLEQIVLATQKCNFNVLPCGAAALAQCYSNVWLKDIRYEHIAKTIPDLPKLVISGSATELTASQIEKLEKDEAFSNVYFIPLKIEDIMGGVTEEMVERVAVNLGVTGIVCVHSSGIAINPEADGNALLLQGITKERFISMITTYLAELTKRVLERVAAILITLGGETSCKCCKSIDSKTLHIVDAVAPAMPLCMNYNAQWVVTKSGNLGNEQTLVDILKYFESHK